MDFRLTKEQEMMQKLCREFAVNEVEPIAAEIDEQERYPFETVEKMRKLGLMGSVPEGSRRLRRRHHLLLDRNRRSIQVLRHHWLHYLFSCNSGCMADLQVRHPGTEGEVAASAGFR